MSIPTQPGATEVREEMDVIEHCVTALTRIENDPVTLGRVMAYLNSRFRKSPVTRDQQR